ncbi:hypothetical protein ENBRE01_1399, partial [Enteropsectra breve]
VEPKAGGMAEFEAALKKYRAKIEAKKPSILLCVFRGKASEGIDFKDEYARAVVAIGIPFPSVKDPQIAAKKEYNERFSARQFNGRQWYEAQAYRALNQALGRAIRHANDWGAIFLLDSRFGEKRSTAPLSGWVAQFITTYEKYEECSMEYAKFIKSKK